MTDRHIIGQYQWEFRPGKSTIDQILTLRQILEKTRDLQIDTHYLFIDFRQAYDSIVTDELYSAMSELGTHPIPMAKKAFGAFTTTKGFMIRGFVFVCLNLNE